MLAGTGRRSPRRWISAPFRGFAGPAQRGKVIYPLDEVLLLCLLAVLAGAEAITDIARFVDRKLDLPRRFRPFADGTPAHDHLGDILASLDAAQFQRCFAAWVARRPAPLPTPSAASIQQRGDGDDLVSLVRDLDLAGRAGCAAARQRPRQCGPAPWRPSSSAGPCRQWPRPVSQRDYLSKTALHFYCSKNLNKMGSGYGVAGFQAD